MASILFKSPDEDQERDPYTQAFLDADLPEPYFVPVLQHQLVNEQALSEIIANGPTDVYGGVIVTSGRAAEAWHAAARRCSQTNATKVIPDWRETPFYVVGAKTGKLLSRTESTSTPKNEAERDTLDERLVPTIILGGEESGTGMKLARFILSDYPKRATAREPSFMSSDPSNTAPSSPVATPSSMSSSVRGGIPIPSKFLPLLYLVGDKTTGSVASTLYSHGIHTKSQKCYETWARQEADFDKDINRILATLPQTGGKAPNSLWLVFFAPSSSSAVLPVLEKHFSIARHFEEAPRNALSLERPGSPFTYPPSPVSPSSAASKASSSSRWSSSSTSLPFKNKSKSPKSANFPAVPPSPAQSTPASSPVKMTARLAAIGPTTASFLSDGEGLHVNVVPTQPTPESLAEAIVGASTVP